MNRTYPPHGADVMVVTRDHNGDRQVMIGDVIPDPTPTTHLSIEPRAGGVWRVAWERVLLIDEAP